VAIADSLYQCYIRRCSLSQVNLTNTTCELVLFAC